MKNAVKKILCAVFSAVLLLYGAACGKNGTENAGNGSDHGDSEVKEMTLFEDGKSEYKIVYPDERTDAEEYAASVLRDYLFQISGVNLPVKQEKFVNYGENAKIISVGGTAYREKAGISALCDTIEGDSFLIKTSGENIFIDGGNDRGTLYGVYEFLDKYLGVKFLTYDYTYVPKLARFDFGKIDDLQIPSFRYRNFMIAGYNDNKEYMSRMRFVNEYHTISDKLGGNIGWYTSSEVSPSHNSLCYVPVEYASSYPQMFSIVNGTPVEICQTYGITEDGEIDESVAVSPIRIAIESLKKFVSASDPEVSFFMFGQQDTQRCCTCSRCKKDAEKYTRGGMNIRFVNLLAREVQKWADEELGGRKINVVTFAYQYSEEPPVYVDDDGKYRPIDDTVVAEDNVYVRLATYFCDNYFSLEDPRQIAKYRTLLSAWDTVADKFMLWDYHIDYYNYFNYYPTMQTWKDNLRLYREIGTEYVLMQSAQNEKVNWQANMEAYVASKLLWNIDRDVDELVDEFMTYYYGMAKDFVAEFKLNNDLYYRTLYERFSDYTLKLGSDSSASKYFDIGYLEKQIALMDRAVEAVSASSLDEKEKETLIARLKIIRAQPKFMIMLNYNSYYFDRQSEYRSYVDELLAELAQLGFTRYSEGSLLNEYKKNHGIG